MKEMLREIEEKGFNITRLYILHYLELSMKSHEIVYDEKTQDKMIEYIYNSFLDTDIQISRITYIVTENWKDIENGCDLLDFYNFD